jgi:phosphate uptake regulator
MTKEWGQLEAAVGVPEKRKVSQLGGTSLMVSLPVDWARLMGVKKGDEVYVYPEGLSLVITPRERARGRGAAEVALKDAEGTAIEVFARYIQGFDVISVSHKGSRANVPALLELIDSHLLGVQVLSESRDSLTLQVFTREHASLHRLLKRLRFVLNSLSNLLVQELRSKEFDSAQIRVLVKSTFKLYFLTLRLLYGASRSSPHVRESRLSFAELLSYALCVKNIGGVLNALVNVVRSYDDLHASSKQDEKLLQWTSKAFDLYSRCLTAFLKKEKLDFGAVRNERRELINAVNLISSSKTTKRLSVKEAMIVRSTELLVYQVADGAGELMELAANIEGVE